VKGYRVMRRRLSLNLMTLAVALILVGCAAPPSAPTPTPVAARLPITPGTALALHVLNRLAYGPDAESLASIEMLGVDRWIEQQLDPASLPESAALSERLATLESVGLDSPTVYERYHQLPAAQRAADPQADALNRERMRGVVQEARAAHLYRAVYSRRQLQEMMVDFWFNHFNIYAEKFADRLYVGDYENRAIRPHVFGRFRDLLEATARHPAMLTYLDNVLNTAPDSPGARGNAEGLNENYAREVMELHTLGVDGGYSQADVTTLARILTGWGVINPNGVGRTRRVYGGEDGFAFYPDRHDFSDKVFLGHAIKGSGMDEVEQALDILADSPATAHHISFQLAQYFVADDPPKALVDRLSERWQTTHGDIREVLKSLFASPDFRDLTRAGSKFKTPQAYVISALRAAEVAVNNPRPLFGTLNRLGEGVFDCLTPDGFKNTRETWLNSDSLDTRLGFATALGSGQMGITLARTDYPLMPTKADAAAPPLPVGQRPVALDSQRLALMLGPVLSAKTESAVAQTEPALKAVLLLGSPDFMAR